MHLLNLLNFLRYDANFKSYTSCSSKYHYLQSKINVGYLKGGLEIILAPGTPFRRKLPF